MDFSSIPQDLVVYGIFPFLDARTLYHLSLKDLRVTPIFWKNFLRLNLGNQEELYKIYDLIISNDDLDLLLYVVSKVGIRKSLVQTLIQHQPPHLYNGLVERYYGKNPELERIVYDLLDFSWFHDTKTIVGALKEEQQIHLLERCLRAYIHGEASLNRYLSHVLNLPNISSEDLLFKICRRYSHRYPATLNKKFHIFHQSLVDLGKHNLAARFENIINSKYN